MVHQQDRSGKRMLLRLTGPLPPQHPVHGLPAELLILGRRFESYFGSQPPHTQSRTHKPHSYPI